MVTKKLKRSRHRILFVIRESLIILTIVVGLTFFLEMGLRFFFPQTVRTEVISGGYLGLNEAGIGHLNRPKSHTIQSGPEFSVEIRISPDGLRDESSHINPRPPNQTRVLLLGDSFTFGVGNDYKDIWPVILEHNLLDAGYNVDIVKAGVCEYDTTVELRLLERLFPKYHPDIVVFVFLPNDLFTNTPIGFPTYLEQKYNPDESGLPVSRTSSFLRNLNTVILLKRILFSSDYLYARTYLSTSRAQYYRMPMNSRLKGQIALTKKLLLQAKSYCEQRSAIFMVFSIPQQFQVIAKARNFEFRKIDVDLIDQVFSTFASSNSFFWIPVLDDLARSYQVDHRPLYFRYDGHLNKSGNEIVGDFFSEEFIHLFDDQLKEQS